MTTPPSDPPAPAPGSDHATTAPGQLDRALALVRFLRANCPWDARQTPESLVPHLIEEAHEVVDAIHAGDAGALEGELGDLLLNLAFQIVLGEETGRFDADSVTREIEEKMARRHPHLYGRGDKEDWERLKARERGEPHGVLDGLASGLDPLSRAHRMQDRVAGVGFDWADYRGAWDKVAEELDEVRDALENVNPDPSAASAEPDAAVEEELGDLLFAAVNLVRLAGSHPVGALERANRKFRRRFESLEALAAARGVTLGDASLEELDTLWDEIKAREVPQQ
ncbi:MAG: nucleoside triphosphate pyrophosphohydrolase [Gemmatimonadetes bacterium]|nr:nucleoside triphosphate pyrophosphohydrolase [Gemmatimonadota bacterium]